MQEGAYQYFYDVPKIKGIDYSAQELEKFLRVKKDTLVGNKTYYVLSVKNHEVEITRCDGNVMSRTDVEFLNRQVRDYFERKELDDPLYDTSN